VYKYYSAIYLLQVQAQALIDIVVRAASALGYEVEGYIDAGRKLRIANVINDEELNLYRSIVGFRNIIVHQYGAVRSVSPHPGVSNHQLSLSGLYPHPRGRLRF
jgi:uncharacterized protein YutE (UPF0331/DUF86 family)